MYRIFCFRQLIHIFHELYWYYQVNSSVEDDYAMLMQYGFILCVTQLSEVELIKPNSFVSVFNLMANIRHCRVHLRFN